MSTGLKRKTTEPASVASSPATPAERLQAHQGLAAAKEKLNQLDSERAAVQARLDQARAAMHDANAIASKILAGESLTAEDEVHTEFEAAKLRGYELAIARQRAEIEKQLGLASREICDAEAGLHRQQSEELVAAADKFFGSLTEMEEHVTALRVAGVVIDNRFGIFSQGRLKTMVLGLQPIVGEFKAFLNQ